MQIDIQRDRARSMRRVMTHAEVLLWNQLRRRQLKGLRFNRQVEIGPFIADFVCRRQKFIVEVEGATHGEHDEVLRDKRREMYLRSRGFEVFRVTNLEIYTDVSDVLDKIAEALEMKAR